MQLIHDLPTLPPRPLDGHKGLFGRVLVVGGSGTMLGAPALAGTAALRMGAGLVQVATPESILLHVLSITPELIGLALGNDDRSLLEAADKANALVVGPGMGQSPEARRRVLALIELDQPMVLDADGLNIIAAQKTWPVSFKAQAVLTPHPGEMARLAPLIGREHVGTTDAERIDIAGEAARAFKQTIVLKGHRTVVTDGQKYYINRTGDSSLSKAGAGDVLSGILGCLLAQKISPFDSACLAVHLHGRCGEIIGKKLGRRSVLARDLVEAIGEAVR